MDYVDRALVSVSDTTGLVDLVTSLDALGFRLVATDGTTKFIKDAKVKVRVTKVETFTGFPAILGGLVKTLHPMIFGGVLAARDLADHRRDMSKHGIKPFQLVVVNLYDFVGNPSTANMDIGGHALIRSAMKNRAFVGILTSPSQYRDVIDELERDGELSSATRLRLAREAAAYISAYDRAVEEWLNKL